MNNRMPLSRSILLLLFFFGWLLLGLWIYWPGHVGPALLDDRSNILPIVDLAENPDLARDYIFGNKSGPLGRPVSVGSFVLEKLYIPGGIARSKQVNIILHLINFALLAYLFSRLLQWINAPRYQWLGVMLAAGWLLSPINVSSTLYVVQRMAMLATTFMLVACICYVRWREGLRDGKSKWLSLLLVPACFLLALLSKENAVVLVPILLLMEALWFQFEGGHGKAIPWLRNLSLGLIGGGALVTLLLLGVYYEFLTDAHVRRSFSLTERVLTQSRILWDYLAQIGWPDTARMGIYHDDVVVSRSLFEPITTLYSLLGWGALAIFSGLLLYWKWGRYLVFALSWFLAGHVTESTVWPLELYFEHRNYFPGMGVFLAAGVVLALAMRQWAELGRPLLVYAGLAVMALALQTSSQVQIWSNYPLLILSTVNAHPESPRANIDMAVLLAGVGDYNAARVYSHKASEAAPDLRTADNDLRDMALSCIANKPIAAEQLALLGTQGIARPLSSGITLHTMVQLLQDETCPNFDRIAFADRMRELFLVEDFATKAAPTMYLSLAILENALARYEYALAYVEQYLNVVPGNSRGLLMKLHFTTALGKVDSADAAVDQLKTLDLQGKLTVGEQQTLALYLEKP
jgi:protein O-mannosyl-transferase